MSLYIGKWCKHCQKTNHDTNECWSTHAIDPLDDPLSNAAPGGWLDVMKGALAAHAKVASRGVAGCIALGGSCEWPARCEGIGRCAYGVALPDPLKENDRG